jgi:NTE family protein
MRWNAVVPLVPFAALSLLATACTPNRFSCPTPGSAAARLAPVPLTEKCFEGTDAVPDFPFENLAVEGGGAKGVAYGGALEALEQAGILGKLERIAGTSAGSITAALIALGYTPGEVRALLMDLDLAKLKDDGAAGPERIVEDFGWYSGEYYLSWVQCQVAAKTGDPDTTFRELHERNQAQGLPDLYVVTTDLTRSTWEVLSHETVPCMPVATAVRLSGSLPFFFNALRLDLAAFQPGPDGACRPVSETKRGNVFNVFSDGGVLLNYPLPLFDTAFFVDGGSRDDQEINLKTLGLHLDPPSARRPPLRIDSLPEYAESVAEAYLQSQTDYFLNSSCDQARSARIDDLGVATTDFGLTREQKLALIKSGFDHTCRYLKQWSQPAVAETCGEAQPSRARPVARP